jgi:hypothetical protein
MNMNPMVVMIGSLWLFAVVSGFYTLIFGSISSGVAISIVACAMTPLVVLFIAPQVFSQYPV